jgi:hypothetical protein
MHGPPPSPGPATMRPRTPAGPSETRTRRVGRCSICQMRRLGKRCATRSATSLQAPASTWTTL